MKNEGENKGNQKIRRRDGEWERQRRYKMETGHTKQHKKKRVRTNTHNVYASEETTQAQTDKTWVCATQQVLELHCHFTLISRHESMSVGLRGGLGCPCLRDVFRRDAERQHHGWRVRVGGEEHTGFQWSMGLFPLLKPEPTPGFLLACSLSLANSELPHTGGTTEERQRDAQLPVLWFSLEEKCLR